MSAIAFNRFDISRLALAADAQCPPVLPGGAPQGLILASGAVQIGPLAVTPRDAAPRWLMPALQALAQLAHLRKNWDGYGSPPLRPAALQAAHRLVKSLEKRPLPIPQIYPVTGGGVGFVWQLGTRELEIEILPDGSARYLAVLTDPATAQEAMQEESLPLERPEYGIALAKWLISD